MYAGASPLKAARFAEGSGYAEIISIISLDTIQIMGYYGDVMQRGAVDGLLSAGRRDDLGIADFVHRTPVPVLAGSEGCEMLVLLANGLMRAGMAVCTPAAQWRKLARVVVERRSQTERHPRKNRNQHSGRIR